MTEQLAARLRKLATQPSKANRYERPLLKWLMTLAFAAACVQTAVDLLSFHARIEYRQQKGLVFSTSMTPTIEGAVDISRVAPQVAANLPRGVTPMHYDAPVLELGVQFGWLGVALLVFVLAEVFAIGVRLRQDVEGLV